MNDDIDIEDMIAEGYDYEEINEALADAGYDAEDMADAWSDVGYDWNEALLDTVRENLIDQDYFEEHAREWADDLDMSISDLYDVYFGYEEG